MNENDRVRKAVESLYEEAVGALSDLVRIDSTTGREQKAQDFIEQLMKSLNIEVDRWCPTDEELREMDDYSICGASNLGQRPNVVGIVRGAGNGRSLILNGHIDTVPVNEPDRWIYPPYSAQIADGKLYGRGSSDMKAGLIAALYAYKALKTAGIVLDGDLIIQSVISEEDGGAGALACHQRGYRADAAIIMEPTDTTVTTAETGTMLMRIILEGKPAHGSAPYAGVSAIEKWNFLLGRINEWDQARHAASPDSVDPRFSRYQMVAPISFGKVHAGNWCAMLPNELVAEGRLGFMLDGCVASARADFEQALLSIAQEDEWLSAHPPKVEWFPTAWEAYNLASDHPLVHEMQAACRAMELSDELGGIPFGTDIKFMKSANIPTVLFGPGTITKAHFDDEYVVIDEFKKAIGVLAYAILGWCNTKV